MPREYKRNVQGWEKMYAEKRVVIVVAVVFVVCALLFCNAAPAIAATPASATLTATTNTTTRAVNRNATPAVKPASTTLTATTNTTTPATNQPFTLSGTLTANGTPLPGKTITLTSIALGRTDPSGNWSVVGTTTTDAVGTYTFTHNEPVQGSYSYTAIFPGDTYAPANAVVNLGVGNLQESVISIFSTNYTLTVNQSYSLYGFLQDGVSGAPIANQSICLVIRCPSGQLVNMWTTTDANGAYTITRSESAQGTYEYFPNFEGNSSYFATTSMLVLAVGFPISTIISLNITNTNPDVNQSFTISGYLTDINGTKLSGRALIVETRLPTGQWTFKETATDSNGYYSITLSEQSTGQYRYEVHFEGDSNSVEVAVGILQPANISANTSVTNPSVGESYTLSGTLTAANGTPLSAKEIDLYQVVVGSPAHLAIFQTRYTDQNGHYFVVLNESTSGNYVYTAIFNGDQTYAYAKTAVKFTVGTLTPTSFTITTNNTNPALNQPFTLSGYLKDNATGAALSGKLITLGRIGPSGTWGTAATTTTDANGAYTFTRSESQGSYSYEALFLGDTYAPATALVILTVGTLTPTTITLTTNTTNPAPNQSFTLSGTLTTNGTPLSGKLITFLSEDPSGNWSRVGTTTTDTNGAYTFTRSESSQGNYDYQARFAGDIIYGSSFASVRIGVGNLQKSVTSLLATNNTPAVNQTFTLYGFLQDGVSGAPLAGQHIILWITSPSGQNVSMGTTTDTNGTYTFTRSESTQGTYVYQVDFWGSSSYFASTPSMLELTVGNPIPTTLSLNITNNNPGVNQSFTISGYLTDINGTKLSRRALTVWARLPTGPMAPRGETATDSNGYYSVTISEQNSGQYRYEVDFPGDGTYAHNANWVLVAIGTLQPTKISANTNVTNPGVGESYTLFGNLTDANGTPLSGKEIDLYQYVTGQLTQRESILQTRYTDQNGHYLFILNESTSANYTYTARFCGDQIYAYSQASVSLTVGTLTPTAITLTTSNATLALNQPFTLSGTLKANNTPLSGKSITLGRTDPSGHWSAANTTTTATNGTYTFTRSESARGVYTYQAVFFGDTYAPANSAVSLTVGTT